MSTASASAAAATIARVPFVVARTSVSPSGGPEAYSEGEFPRSKPSGFTHSRSPASTAPFPSRPWRSRARSMSPQASTRL